MATVSSHSSGEASAPSMLATALQRPARGTFYWRKLARYALYTSLYWSMP